MCGHSRQRVLACLLSDLAWGSLSLLPIRWRNTQGSCQLRSIGVMTVLGWCMLCFFLPVGMWSYPFDYVGSYIHRPRPMK